VNKNGQVFVIISFVVRIVQLDFVELDGNIEQLLANIEP
jgi:hypothetical protein